MFFLTPHAELFTLNTRQVGGGTLERPPSALDERLLYYKLGLYIFIFDNRCDFRLVGSSDVIPDTVVPGGCQTSNGAIARSMPQTLRGPLLLVITTHFALRQCTAHFPVRHSCILYVAPQ